VPASYLLRRRTCNGAGAIFSVFVQLAAVLLLLTGSGRIYPADLPLEGVVVDKIIVNRSNIFASANGQPLPLVAAAINRFHKPTLESVILREIEVKPGDTVTPEDVVDFERRLRSLNIFASVSASLVTADEGVELLDLEPATEICLAPAISYFSDSPAVLPMIFVVQWYLVICTFLANRGGQLIAWGAPMKVTFSV